VMAKAKKEYTALEVEARASASGNASTSGL